nr:hypothetical protein BaRGS_011814 [Batillaria attramentaria]
MNELASKVFEFRVQSIDLDFVALSDFGNCGTKTGQFRHHAFNNHRITAHTYTADRATKAPPEVSEDG